MPEEIQTSLLYTNSYNRENMVGKCMGMSFTLHDYFLSQTTVSNESLQVLKLEQLDQEPSFPPDTAGVSLDGTGQVGTYFYTAPEIEQGWPKIDEKADMYSLGVVFFELWHPFGTAMERNHVLSDLKLKGELPPAWVAEFPEQASLLRRLMSPSPSDRPSATELLKHAFPPRMESELLDNILRTMQTSEDRSVYDKVLNAIFDEEMLSMKDQQHHDGRLGSVSDISAIQYADYTLRLVIMLLTAQGRCSDSIVRNTSKNTVKLLTHGGDMLELCHELRLPFVSWVISSQRIKEDESSEDRSLPTESGKDAFDPDLSRSCNFYLCWAASFIT
ncbi:unnamed protein product [Prunus armeniaca]|uniref:Protein kinase domain-containing protein n=1 Tax=Prunus armeniaca TaxID=36596 RepID=A0A6J5W0K5_PRUAR|nr:unnamed protein product [Prunus armeniaca]